MHLFIKILISYQVIILSIKKLRNFIKKFKYIEEMAREKYRMAKKGEKVFKVIEKKND